MTVTYYHLQPVILTDDIYTQMGGQTGTSTAFQRHAAYQIAEELMIEHLGTFLLPTTVTGIFEFHESWPHRYQLPHERINSIDAVSLLSKMSCCDCEIQKTDGCALIVDAEYGIIDAQQLRNCLCSSCSVWNWPYQIQIAYTAGFPTGVAANDHALQLSLMMIAEITLKEMFDPGANEGGPGDPGINQFVSMGYSEQRVPLMKTRLGNSARANHAYKLVEHLRKKRALKMGLTP